MKTTKKVIKVTKKVTPKPKKKVKKERVLLLNRAKCLSCGDIVTSYGRHDYVSCKCGKMAVDGGMEYARRTGTPSEIEEMCVYSDSPFSVIRESLCRGGRGKDGTEPLKWVPISQMSNEWLAACITYNDERGLGKSISNKMYNKELVYRKKKKIVIAD